jgi:hypothetical protein
MPAAAWSLWATFFSLWVASLVPFYAAGMNHFSAVALGYAGEPSYGKYGVPYAATFDTVYGTSIVAGIARSIICFGPLVFALAIGGMLLRLLIDRRGYSRQGIILRIMALLATLVLLALSYDLAWTFLIWGLG